MEKIGTTSAGDLIAVITESDRETLHTAINLMRSLIQDDVALHPKSIVIATATFDSVPLAECARALRDGKRLDALGYQPDPECARALRDSKPAATSGQAKKPKPAPLTAVLAGKRRAAGVQPQRAPAAGKKPIVRKGGLPLAAMIYDAMLKHSKPVIASTVHAMIRNDPRITAIDKPTLLKRIGTILWRHKSFRRIDTGLYALADAPAATPPEPAAATPAASAATGDAASTPAMPKSERLALLKTIDQERRRERAEQGA